MRGGFLVVIGVCFIAEVANLVRPPHTFATDLFCAICTAIVGLIFIKAIGEYLEERQQ